MEKQTSNFRWVVLVSVLMGYFLIVTQRTAPGLISDQLMKDFDISAATIGLLTSMQFLAYSGLQIPIGILSDRFGPNFFLIVGTVINGIGTFMYSLASNEMGLLVARFLVGMGDATIWINLVLILSQWFTGKEFIGLIGIAGMCGSMGSLTATVPFTAWISLAGWRTVFFTVGMILFLWGIFLYFVLVKRPRQLKLTDMKGNSHTNAVREKTLVILRRLLSNRQSWATFLCHFGIVGTYIGFIGSWAVPYGMSVYGMTRSGASQLIMIGLLGAIIGAPLSTWISGRLEKIKQPYIVAQTVNFLCWVAFLLFSGKPPFILVLLLFFIIGFGNGTSTLTFAVVRQSFSNKEVGLASGFANTGGFISAILLPGIFGKVLDYFHTTSSIVGYHYGFIIPVFFSAFGILGGILIKKQPQIVPQLIKNMTEN